MLKSTLFILFIFLLLLTACSPTVVNSKAMLEQPTEAMVEALMEKTPDTMMDETPDTMMDETSDTMMEETPDTMMEETPDTMMEKSPATPDAKGEMGAVPAWFGAVLNNVRTGEDFTIKDFKEKVVLVETLAMWCPSCKRQQAQVKAIYEALGMDSDLIVIGLDIDPNENAEDLKAYSESNGFDWIYAIAPAEVAREIGMLYGDQFLNPPSTPLLIIDRQGMAHPLPFGIKSADDLMKYIDPFLKEGM